MQCPSCKYGKVLPEFSYCPHCGASLKGSWFSKRFFSIAAASSTVFAVVMISWAFQNRQSQEVASDEENWRNSNLLVAVNNPSQGTTSPFGAGVESSSTSISWLLPIDIQLRALRSKDLNKAYTDPTAKDFQEATPFEDFKKFIDHFPLFFTHNDISVKAQTVQENQADITIILNPEKEAIAVRYLLKKENGNWKIWSMNVAEQFSETVSALLKDPKLIREPVEGQLQALRDREINKAYYDYSSHPFQEVTTIDTFRKFLSEYPIITQYEAIEFKEPMLEKTTGILEVMLHNKYGVTNIEYTLGIEDNKWKIWGIQILPPGQQGQTPTKDAAPTEQEGEISAPTPTPATIHATPVNVPNKEGDAGISFDKAEVGTEIDVQGKILNPASVFKNPTGNIILNLFIHNGLAKQKINVTLLNLESNSTLPMLSTTLQQDGDTILSFSFEPPEKGWPKGHYKVIAATANGLSREFEFTVE